MKVSFTSTFCKVLFQIMLFIMLTFSLIIDDLLTSIACFRPVYVFVVKVGTMEIVVLSGMSYMRNASIKKTISLKINLLENQTIRAIRYALNILNQYTSGSELNYFMSVLTFELVIF